MHVFIFIFDFNFVLMWFELVFCVNMQVGKLEEWSHGENKGKQGRKTKTQQFSHNTSLVRICFCANFQKCMLSVPSQNLSANFTGMRTLCEFVFVTNFQNHALCLGEPQECEIHISSLKAIFSSSNSKLLLHFSQAKDSSHSFFIRNPLSPGRGASKFQISSWKAPISKPSHHEKSFSYLSQHFPPSKAKNFHHLNEPQFCKGWVNSVLCEIFAQHIVLCETRTTLTVHSSFVFPCFSQKSPILTPLQATFKCHCNLYQYTIMAWTLWALSSAAQSGAHSSFL